MKSIRTILLLLGLIAFSFPSIGQAGTVDSTFNADGAAFFYFQGGSAAASSIIVLPNEKILVAGTVVTGPEGDSDILLLRYNPDGLLDASFGQGGFLLYDRNNQDDAAKAMVLQSDGRILVAGWTVNDGKNYGVLCRFLPDGDLDGDFGENGVVYNENELTEIPSTDVFLDKEERILWCLVTKEHDSSIIRYLSNGDVDTTYGKEGEAFFKLPGGVFQNGNWEILPDGKMAAIVMIYSGFFDDSQDSILTFYSSFFLRYSEDGKTREVMKNNSLFDGYINDAVNWQNAITLGDKIITQVSYDGDVVTDFALNGEQKAVPGITNAFALQLDDKLIAVGHDDKETDKSIVVARLQTDGELDKKFNDDGKVFLNFSSNDDIAYATAIDTDDRILVAGQSGDSLMIARLYGSKLTGEPSPGIDSTFFEFRPNPVGDILIADYGLPTDGVITIELMDLYGRLVQSFYTNVTRQAGHYVEPLLMDDGLANGTYFLRFRSGEYHELRKLMLSR